MVTVVLLLPGSASGQWKRKLHLEGAWDWDRLSCIFFLNPSVGFVGGGNAVFRTTDGGNTWNVKYFPIAAGINIVTDFAFMDQDTGWFSESNVNAATPGCYETTDGGDSWFPLPGSECDGRGIYYDSASHGLFISYWQGAHSQAGALVSWDEGKTWSRVSNNVFWGTGFAFNGKGLGTLSTDPGQWLRTFDEGLTWTSIQMDSAAWQPLSLSGTPTQFAITDHSAAVLRTDDGWNTWRKLFEFPTAGNYDSGHTAPADLLAFSSGWIGGDACRLFVQVGTGVYTSTDQGYSWHSTGGVRAYSKGDRRSCLIDNNLFISLEPAQGVDEIWELAIDSLSTLGISPRCDDGTQQTDLRPGDSVGITFVPGAGTLSATDSVELNIEYDPSTISLDSLTIPAGWWITDSSTSGGILTLVLRTDSAESLPDPLLHAEFVLRTGDTIGTKTFIYLDSATSFFTPSTPCALPILTLGTRDSVEVDIPCNDSLEPKYASISERFSDNSREARITPGDSVGVTFVPGAGTLAATDSVRLVIRYDPNAVSLSSLSVGTGWWIADSSTTCTPPPLQEEGAGGWCSLILTLRSDSAGSLPDPLLHAEFQTYLSPGESRAGSPTYATFIYLDSAQSFFPQTTPCAPTALSLQQPDSVELDFTGCGDSILEAEMNQEPPFSIESVVPNPAQTSIAVTVSTEAGPLSCQLFDALGNCVLTKPGAETAPLQLDVSSLPSGIYFLRLSNGSYTVSRSVAIER